MEARVQVYQPTGGEGGKEGGERSWGARGSRVQHCITARYSLSLSRPVTPINKIIVLETFGTSEVYHLEISAILVRYVVLVVHGRARELYAAVHVEYQNMKAPPPEFGKSETAFCGGTIFYLVNRYGYVPRTPFAYISVNRLPPSPSHLPAAHGVTFSCEP